MSAGKRRISSFTVNVLRGRAPTPTGSSTQGFPPMFACETAARIASVCGFVAVPTFTRRPSITDVNCDASPMSSTIAYAAPSAFSARAVESAATAFVMHCTRGPFARSASSASAAVFSTPAAVTPVFCSGCFFLRMISSSSAKSA